MAGTGRGSYILLGYESHQVVKLYINPQKSTYQLGWTLCGRPKSSILRVPGDNLSMMP